MTEETEETTGGPYPADAWTLLSPMLTDTRRGRILKAVRARTRHIRLVAQDIHNPHNVSACFRSAEAFGVQDVDVVTLRETFRASNVAKGVAHWLTIRRHQTVEGCARDLKAQGFRLVAGVPRPDARPLQELPLHEPLAVVFGNEQQGIDAAWLDHVDFAFTIPMVGLVESLNISVSAAITLHYLTSAARAQVPPEVYHLSEAAQNELLNAWACKQVANWQGVIERLRGG